MEVVMKHTTADDGQVDRVLKIRMWGKTKAFNDLARHFQVLTDVVQVSSAMTLTEKIAAARQGAQTAGPQCGQSIMRTSDAQNPDGP